MTAAAALAVSDEGDWRAGRRRAVVSVVLCRPPVMGPFDNGKRWAVVFAMPPNGLTPRGTPPGPQPKGDG